MRTTVTLDDDVLLTVREEMRVADGKTFKQALNDLIRMGRLAGAKSKVPPKPFVIKARNLGSFAHINYDKTSELLAMLDEVDKR